MKLFVEHLVGDALITFYNKTGDLIHSESFYSDSDEDVFTRDIPINVLDFGHASAVSSKRFNYKVMM